jgi:hypothetical protein
VARSLAEAEALRRAEFLDDNKQAADCARRTLGHWCQLAKISAAELRKVRLK